ncbi:MAG: DNA-directed RNA polymerase subunit beta, partial [Oscillospiraceae bacterium]|nr:DNA-directed RNA polymerase subunit beta [Oscillospiraceae bacterium]
MSSKTSPDVQTAVSVKDVQVGKNTRKSFGKIDEVLQMPNLIEVQKKSYEWFLTEGLREVFRDVASITDFNGNLQLSFIVYRIDDTPKYTIAECKERDATYAAPLRVKARLWNQETDEVTSSEIYMGDMPLMTESGTFVINGAERVIVSQIVRSPGAYFDSQSDDKTGRDTYSGELIPSRGTWLEFLTDDKKNALGRLMNMSVDRKRKILSTILLKCIGFALNLE